MSSCCIVIPCFNETGRIQPELFLDFLRKNPDYTCLFVDDGSTDQTANLLRKAGGEFPERWLVHQQVPNGGKAAAVRSGMLLAAEKNTYDYIGFLDADLSAPLFTISDLYAVLEKENAFHSAFGSRIKRLGAKVERKVIRHILGRIFATLTTVVLKVASYDSQCGAKLFRREMVPVLFADSFVSNWFFDLEIIIRADRTGIVEVPVRQWKEVGKSKIKWTDFLKAPFELLRIRRHYRVK